MKETEIVPVVPKIAGQCDECEGPLSQHYFVNYGPTIDTLKPVNSVLECRRCGWLYKEVPLSDQLLAKAQ